MKLENAIKHPIVWNQKSQPQELCISKHNFHDKPKTNKSKLHVF
jgi:hypothetical protein